MEMSGISYANKNVTPQNTSNYDDNIYDDIEDQESQRTTNHPGTSQNPGPDSAGRCYKVTGVVLLLLCGLLLSGVTALWVMYNHLATEKNQLQTSYDTMRNQTEQEKVVRQKLLTSLATDMNWILFSASIYYINTQNLTWSESRQACKDRGADLIIINSQEEQDIFVNLRDLPWFWIGLSDIDTEGQWKWVDGSLLTTGYWYTGNPNGGTAMNCVLFYNNWFDYPCSYHFQSICETEI